MLPFACMARFYITTAILYTNAPPHIGFALELVQADVLARYRRMMGDEVRFLTGTDEHGTKVARSAQAAGMEPQQFVDSIAVQVKELAEKLSISNTDFIRTTDRQRHWPAAEKLWRKLAENGDIYRKAYEGHYCVGHEAFMRSDELVEGRCPLHKVPAELVREENWFFRLTRHKESVRGLIGSGRIRIVPETRKNEILNLFDEAEDVSFSRPRIQLPWGIPVPDDPEQTMYVWADALANYISALGYCENSEEFRDFWPADVHLIGKDILRFHAMLWPAMLLSAGLEVPRAIYVHGFINVEGEKMSKSLGNVVDPVELLKHYGAEPLRYYLLRELPSTDDGDFSRKNLENRYQSDLANGLGNLIQRTRALIISKFGGELVLKEKDLEATGQSAYALVMDDARYHEALAQFRLHDALSDVWRKIGLVNAFISEREPWKEGSETVIRTLSTALVSISHVAWLLQPFMPSTALEIAKILGVPLNDALADGHRATCTEGKPLFPR